MVKMIISICLLIIILIKNSNIVFSGAATGLMLWFNNVIPLLLPFMLLSKLLAGNICRRNFSGSKAILFTIIPGLLCGYPIGAYTVKNYLNNNLYSKRTAELLLPLCNNSSPMFISGFIIHKSLQNSVGAPVVFMVLYLPYIIYAAASVIINRVRNQNFTYSDNQYTKACKSTVTDEEFDISELILSISSIGVYIILCSAAAELLLAANEKALAMGYITENLSSFIDISIACIEITRGAGLITGLSLYGIKKITALILALTSFGGISSILQTRQVIQNSGLSIKKYILVKLICGCASYFLALLMI
jgi:hypothetical protein